MATESTPETPPSPEKKAVRLNRLIAQFLVFFRDRLNLDDDKADPEETSEYIRKGIEFKGTNIWILIFAILIASIGLNVNSAAVIIGAMLISPLMGPIMGIGLGAGVNDFELVKRAGKNLALMVTISVATSTLYFLLSPLGDAHSELLNRTQPTIWDVLIALSGGLAGIVAGSRKEKSNAIPGVAIATALMPPLCTAGYGLATQQWPYFLGAFYLFTINSVFISFSTYVVVRFLRYPQKTFMDAAQERRVKRWIAAFVILTTLPSLYIAFNLVQDTVLEREASIFVNENAVFPNTQVISKNFNLKGDEKRIELALLGEQVSDDTIESMRVKLKQNKRLKDVELVVRQGGQRESGMDLSSFELMNKNVSGIINDLYKSSENALKTKDEQIRQLEQALWQYKSREVDLERLPAELKALYADLEEMNITRSPVYRVQDGTADTVTFAYMRFNARQRNEDLERLSEFIQTRTKSDSLRMVIEVK